MLQVVSISHGMFTKNALGFTWATRRSSTL